MKTMYFYLATNTAIGIIIGLFILLIAVFIYLGWFALDPKEYPWDNDENDIMKTRLTPDELINNSRGYKNRVKQTISFIDPTDMLGRVADCGEANMLKLKIELHFGIIVETLDWNFNDVIKPEGRYDTILAFEVLEHVYNPLTFLLTVRNWLNKDGCIYLSTPRIWPQCMRSPHHFHEIPTDRLMWLFEEAGLKIVKQGKVRFGTVWYRHLLGPENMLRYFFKTRIYKLVKE